MQSQKFTMSILVLLVFATTFSAAQIVRDFHSSSPHQTLDAEMPPVVATTGTLTVKYTITVNPAIPTHGVIACSADAIVSNDSGGAFPSEHGEALATLVSGKNYSCTVVMHYSWPLASVATDRIQISGGASLLYGYQVTASNGTAVVVEPITVRNAHQNLASIAVPANGASTTLTPSLTL